MSFSIERKVMNTIMSICSQLVFNCQQPALYIVTYILQLSTCINLLNLLRNFLCRDSSSACAAVSVSSGCVCPMFNFLILLCFHPSCTLWLKNWTCTKFSNNFNKYWLLSIIVVQGVYKVSLVFTLVKCEFW